jgi:tetratricopeptide (TPR) repeat protein
VIIKVGLSSQQFDKNQIAAYNPSLLNAIKCDARSKKWCNESHISNSNYLNEPYTLSTQQQHDQFESIKSCDELRINTLMRSMLPHDACCLFREHVRGLNRIAIEIEWKGRHIFGLIDCEELLHVNRKRIRQAVPLYEFHASVFKRHCSYESVFRRNSKPSEDGDGTRDLKEIPAVGENGQQMLMVVEIELNKPLNEEIIEEIPTSMGDNSNKFQKNHSWEQFRREILLTSRRLIEKHGGIEVNKIIEKVISSGDFSQIQNHLASKILELEKNFGSSAHFKSHLTSYVVNNTKKKDDDDKLLLANIYAVLNLSDEAEELLLSAIADDRDSEKLWTDFAIFNAREENFDKMSVGIDKVLKINEKSLLGNLLLTYKFFKLQKTAECLNLVHFLKTTHGALEELKIIEHVVNRSVGNENLLSKSSTIENDVVNSVYERDEIMWKSKRGESLLNLENPFVRCAVFFTKIGSYEFAELCLSEYYSTHGVNINYLYLLSAIDMQRRNYANALIHLNKIARDDVASHQVNVSQTANVIAM